MFKNLIFQEKTEKRENVKNILTGGSDDTIAYRVLLSFVFNDFESFEVRKDIKIPRKDGSDGVVIAFNDGRIAYFKTQKDPLSDDEFESILNVCYFLQDKFGGAIEAYILCYPDVEFRVYEGIERDGITLVLNTLRHYDGDATLEMLESKLKNKEEFTFQDYVCHILLPYMGSSSPDEFLPKFQRYMMEVMFDNAERQGIEVARL